MPNCPLCNSYVPFGIGHACSKTVPADEWQVGGPCSECARKEVELRRLRDAIAAMKDYHTCHFHPHVVCTACEVQRRAKE